MESSGGKSPEILDACCGGRHCAFQLVLFDPPHNVRDDPDNGYIGLKYGALSPDTEQEDLHRGFAECWRVLAPGGTLVFKWAGALEHVNPHFPATPVVSTRTPRGGQTQWFIFYKALAPQDRAERSVQTLLGVSYA